jgi:hypothetical protein
MSATGLHIVQQKIKVCENYLHTCREEGWLLKGGEPGVNLLFSSNASVGLNILKSNVGEVGVAGHTKKAVVSPDLPTHQGVYKDFQDFFWSLPQGGRPVLHFPWTSPSLFSTWQNPHPCGHWTQYPLDKFNEWKTHLANTTQVEIFHAQVLGKGSSRNHPLSYYPHPVVPLEPLAGPSPVLLWEVGKSPAPSQSPSLLM